MTTVARTSTCAPSRAVAVVGIVLLALTVLSWLPRSTGLGDANLVGAIVLVIAFVKVRLVGIHFMGLRQAPMGFRILFEAYVVAACTVLVVVLLA